MLLSIQKMAATRFASAKLTSSLTRLSSLVPGLRYLAYSRAWRTGSVLNLSWYRSAVFSTAEFHALWLRNMAAIIPR